MLPGIEMMDCRNLAVPAVVMRHIVRVESGGNPFAIGVIGERLARQPRSLDEALATVGKLEAEGHDFSLGVAQVHRANLGKLGLDTYEKAFDPCPNLAAGSRILADCHTRARGDWGKAFSCYYSGNFVTGFRHGYVQKVYDSIARDTAMADAGVAAPPAAPAVRPTREVSRSAPTGVFVPRVRGPRDAPAPPTASHATPASVTDRADLREKVPDGAFVF